MKKIFESVIEKGGYDLAKLLEKIDTYHIEGKLTDQEREDLYALARQTPVAQYDAAVEIEKLWQAIRELQKAGQANSDNSSEAVEEDYPEYVQPTGVHDAYQTGDRMTFKGKKCRCLMDNCVWSPEVLPSAWEIVEEEG